MENQDKTTFSLDDDEIVEEEFIDRDEEYEDDDYDEEDEGDEEEEYDDDYDDDYEEEEDYDDGYNDDYYDDRLNKVLDEIAEIKRNMSAQTPAVQQQPYSQPPFMPPQYIYQPTPSVPSAGSEVVMYNEISRLRDELAKNQSGLEMQKEISRLKDDMARDQKYAESQYNAEIKRLQDRIEDLLKNAQSPQNEQLPPAQADAARLEGGKSEGNKSIDFEKLLSINEAVLRTTKESDARIQKEIAALKSKVDEFPSSEELNNALAAVKKAAASTDALGADAVNRLSGDIAALRAALDDKPVAAAAVAPVAPPPVAVGGNGAAPEISSSELLRQLYEIKNVIGSSSLATVNRTQALLELLADYKQVSFDVHSQAVPFKDKLAEVLEYAKKLTECNEPDSVELMEATNELIETLASMRLTREVFADVASFQTGNGNPVPSNVRNSADRFFNICDKLVEASVDQYNDYIPDLVAERNVLEENRREQANNALVGKITEAYLAEPRDDEAIKDLVAQLMFLAVGDVTEFPLIGEPKAYKPSRSVGDETVISKIEEIKTIIEDAILAKQQAELENAEAGDEQEFAESDEPAEPQQTPNDILLAQAEVQAQAHEEEVLAVQTASQEILDAISELKSALLSKATATEAVTEKTVGVDEALQEIRSNYIDVSERLVQISEKLAEPVDPDAQVMTEEEKQKALDDLEYIHNKIDEQDTFINQIVDLRSDILNISSTIDFTEQYNSIVSEITSQFDKLYEDLSNVVIESEANITNRLNENTGASEAIEAAKADVLADTQIIKDALAGVPDVRTDTQAILGDTQSIYADTQSLVTDAQTIKDTLYIISDSMSQTPVADAVEQLRSDLSAFADLTAANVDASTADRQKLLDDVAFLREQAEAALAEKEQSATASETEQVNADAEQLNAALDDISQRVALLAAVPDELAAVKDNTAVVIDAVAPLAAVPDELAAVKDNTAAIIDAVAPLAEDVASARDAAVATLDALAPITDQINSILERLDSDTYDEAQTETEMGEEQPDTLPEDLAEIKENLNTILDTLPLIPQNDDLITARDNTYSILDTLTMMPQQDDIVTTRDNVTAVLDAVNALTESVNLVLENQSVSGNNDAQNDAVASILQDMSAVLEKLEAFETGIAADKQEILDAVGSIKEEVHISELDENIAAAGIDDETRDALVGEISEIRERLNGIELATQSVTDSTAQALDGIAAQIADLQSAIIAGPEAGAVAGEGIQGVLDELAAIKEKLETGAEYDTVEEILSLRDDVKAARIVDQNDVSGELESIKNELAAISSGNLLDEVRSIRDDIASIGMGGAATPTNDELNLVLNEIVSLRDEMFAFKDEVLNATAVNETQSVDEAEAAQNEDVTTILDELTALRADQNALTDNIDELKDIISRRTTIAPDADGEGAVAADSGLNVVLDEIINLKNDVASADRLDVIAEQVDELRALIEELRAAPADAEEHAAYTETEAVADTAVLDRLDELNAAINELRLGQVAENGEVQTVAGGNEISELRAEIDELRRENEQLRRESEEVFANGFNELREAIRDIALSQQPVATENGDTSYAALIDEIRNLKEQVASVQPAASLDESTLAAIRDALGERTEAEQPLSAELGDIRDEIAQLRSLTTVSAGVSGSEEVAAIRDEIAQLKSMISAPESIAGLAEDVTSIRADVQTLKEEPDLGVMNEILALRDEFQSLREQIEDVKNIAGKTNEQSDDRILEEVQSLRDQLFAISMANVNDSASGESNYETYNNLILDEISMLRDQVGTAGSEDELRALSDEVSQMKSAVEKREDAIDALAARVARLDNDATNNKILDELAELREELANQRDADLTTLNFMSEMAHLLERQNNYLTENAGIKISDEIESLKAELATKDAVASEIANLRDVMKQYGNSSDNDTILNELAELREELSAEKPSRENELILQEIARLRDELTVIAAREKQHSDAVATAAAKDSISDSDLKDSLSDLKNQLNEIAGIVEPEKKTPARKPAAKKPAAKKSTGAKRTTGSGTGAKKSTAGSGTGAKRGRKPAQKRPTPTAAQAPVQVTAPHEPITVPMDRQPVLADDEFEAKLDTELSKLETGGEMSLNPQGPVTADTLDVADKLAQQVANKLIIEQLVEQLGDGGVDDEHVDEILKDILPHEFSTVAMNEQSDKVRRLANQLVLNKLRDRLNGKIGKDDD